MASNHHAVKETIRFLRKRGHESIRIAQKTILQEKIPHEQLREALRYFIKEGFPEIMHPGLLSIYCEAVGGKAEEVTETGAALVLLVAAADIHDDIIDDSRNKNGKPTVLGKYCKNVAILAGDGFFIDGVYLLHKSLDSLQPQRRKAILALTKQAFYDLSSVEAEEALLKRDLNLTGQKYLELLKRKSAVSEATARIGAILGNGNANQVEMLGRIGCIVGVLGTLRDEFIDVFDAEELCSRASNEILPLPVLNVFVDPKKKTQITQLLKGRNSTKQETEKIVDIVMESEETKGLKKEIRVLAEEGLSIVSKFEKSKDYLKLLIEAAIEDLT
jgi:geranylgeranyl pyrophosphate synthase